ncbi:MAG: IclR family transcriptional regulator [Actinomycetota bacterium]
MKSADNTLRIVEAIAAADEGGVGLRELVRRTGIAKSTVHRSLMTLRDRRWIESGPDGGSWRVSTRLRSLLGAVGPTRLRAAAELAMERLAAETGESVHLVVAVDDQVELIHRVEGSNPVQVVLPLGRRVPIGGGATGKALLAAGVPMPERLPRLTPATITDRRRLADELEQIRTRGWATNRGEWHPSIGAVAAAIVADGIAVGALSVSTTVDRLDAEHERSFGSSVVAAAADVAAALRSSG